MKPDNNTPTKLVPRYMTGMKGKVIIDVCYVDGESYIKKSESVSKKDIEKLIDKLEAKRDKYWDDSNNPEHSDNARVGFIDKSIELNHCIADLQNLIEPKGE